MSKIIVSEFVTLDGVMEAPGGEPGHPHTGWVFDFQGDEQIQHNYEEVLEAEALLIGRVTYESFAGAWPHYEGEFADRMNAMPKHVVSTTLRNPEWNNAHVISGDVIAGITQLKQQAGGPLLVAGSLKLVQTLMAHDLIDEYRLKIFPVVLGSGRRLFPESPDKTVLRLADIRAFDSGVVEYTYHPANRPIEGEPGVRVRRSGAHPAADHSGIDCMGGGAPGREGQS
jgi:dihydrofolate reductase